MDEQNQLSQTKPIQDDVAGEDVAVDDSNTVGAGFSDEETEAADVDQADSENESEEAEGDDSADGASDGDETDEEDLDADEPVREEIDDDEDGSPEGCIAKLDDAIRREQIGPDGVEEVVLSVNKLKVLINALRCCEQNISNVVRMLEKSVEAKSDADEPLPSLSVQAHREMELAGVRAVDGRVVEGVFDGQNMVGSDGKIYSVPPNYASKSKLVEGDMLKLTITSSGSFIYKQIGPIERVRVVATLGFDPTVGEYYATSDTKRWNVLKASVTYFKGEPEDEIVVLVPKNGPSKWAAVENIIKKIPNL